MEVFEIDDNDAELARLHADADGSPNSDWTLNRDVKNKTVRDKKVKVVISIPQRLMFSYKHGPPNLLSLRNNRIGIAFIVVNYCPTVDNFCR